MVASRKRKPGKLLVGRDRSVETLVAAIESATQGRGQLIVLTGEAGIGKTALAEAMTVEATSRGARTIWATAWSGEAPDYWPWIQVMRELALDRRSTSLNTLVGRALGGTDAAERAAADRKPDAEEPEASRSALFDATAGALTAASIAQPLIVVLDDLQWADASTWALLDFLARGLRTARIVVLGTYRDLEPADRAVIARSADDLTSVARVIPLEGLSSHMVGQIVANIMGEEPSADLADAIHRQTAGNPFLIEQVTRLLMAQGSTERQDVTGLPTEPRAAVERRLAALSPSTRELLALAAVVGSTFSAPRLAGITGQALPDVRMLLGEATGAQLLTPPSDPLGTHRFGHDLIREAILAGLDSRRLASLHTEVGGGLAAARDRGADVGPGEIAGHLAHGPGLEADVVRYSVLAARDATARQAHDEAARHWQRVHDTLVARPETPGPALGEIDVELARARRFASAIQAVHES